MLSQVFPTLKVKQAAFYSTQSVNRLRQLLNPLASFGDSWRCHLDRCPHRFAPLSQGRIHETGGLQCSYHGWVFGPQGDCTLIPQADEDERKALEFKLACAVALPIKVTAAQLALLYMGALVYAEIIVRWQIFRGLMQSGL